MVEMGKECGFPSNFDMPRPFSQCKTELPRKMANSPSDCRTASCIPGYRQSNELTLKTRLEIGLYPVHLIFLAAKSDKENK